MSDYEYDVAISFLARDEGLASSIHDELAERVKVFLYSKRQESLAGTEGDLEFSRIFQTASRTVLVLYRPDWGETRWTRVEMNAIRSRGLESGWNFCLIAPLDGSRVPEYVPSVNIWYDIGTYGIKALPAIVARMAQERGAQIGKDDAIARGTRLARLEAFRLERIKFRGSPQGIECMRQSFEDVCDRIKVLTNDIAEQTKGAMVFTVKGPTGQKTHADRMLVVLAMNIGLLAHMHAMYANTIDGSVLEISLFKGHPPFPGVINWGKEDRSIASRRFEFDVAPTGPVWRGTNAQKQELDQNSLADFALRFLIEHQERVTREGGGR
jgi:hypothetical protein